MHNKEENELPCIDKANYATQKEADAAALVAKHQHGAKLKAYKCKHCGLWHLASDYS